MKNWKHGTSVWKVAVGVAIGVIVASAVAYAVRMWMLQQALSSLNEQVHQITARQQRAAEDVMRRARFEQEQRARQLQEKEAAERAALAAQQRAEFSLRQAAIDEQARKEDAWARYYRKPPHCEDPPSNEALVQCANEYIRAKRSFEAAYGAGKL